MKELSMILGVGFVLGPCLGLAEAAPTTRPEPLQSPPEADWLPLDLIANTNAEAVCQKDFDKAKGFVVINENLLSGTTLLTFRIQHALPNMVHSIWLRAASPITGAAATPAAPTTALDDLAPFTPPAAGTTIGANAFSTNAAGNATFTTELDFLLSDGFYPFPQGDSPIESAPFTLRVISHCTDGLIPGLLPGTHEPNFQVSLEL